MKTTIITALFLFIILSVEAQYKNDNVTFKTIFPQDLCSEMKKQAGYILLDVRSNGEFNDTSSAAKYNLGHLDNAINIDINEMEKRINEIAAYKDKPVFVYCSHSQRSRRVSTLLVDSGFTNVLNINGGITAIRQLPQDQCLQNLVKTSAPYKVIAVEEICSMINSKKKNIVIVDVRSDSAYKHITGDAKTDAIGYFKGSIHIPLAQLEANMSKLAHSKDVIVVDQNGEDAAKAAVMISKNNWNGVNVMLEGIERYLLSDKDAVCKKLEYISPVKYSVTNAIELNRFVSTNMPYIFLDIREDDEFKNKHKDNWRNIGQLVNNVHIPLPTLSTSLTAIERYKLVPVIVYGFGSGKESFAAADLLSKNGFTDVRVLMGGLFSVRWTAANVKGNGALFGLVTNVPRDNE